MPNLAIVVYAWVFVAGVSVPLIYIPKFPQVYSTDPSIHPEQGEG